MQSEDAEVSEDGATPAQACRVFVRMSSPDETAQYGALLCSNGYDAAEFDDDDKMFTQALAELPKVILVSRDNTAKFSPSEVVCRLRRDDEGGERGYDYRIVLIMPVPDTERSMWRDRGYLIPLFDDLTASPINNAHLLQLVKEFCSRTIEHQDDRYKI